jgi:hypothetical protein
VISSIAARVPTSLPSRCTLSCYLEGVANAFTNASSPISISKTPTYDPRVHEFLDIKAQEGSNVSALSEEILHIYFEKLIDTYMVLNRVFFFGCRVPFLASERGSL